MPTSTQIPLNPPQARSQSRCVVCGPDHPTGLRLIFTESGDGGVAAEWRPTTAWEGFEGIVHGGIISTVLDEAMSKAVAARQIRALTGELRVRFHSSVPSGGAVRVRGWVTEQRKRLLKTEAALTAPDGVEYAHAWAMFVMPPRAIDVAVSRDRQTELSAGLATEVRDGTETRGVDSTD